MTPSFAKQIEGSPTLAALQKEADRLQLLLNVTHILPWEASHSISNFTYVGDKAQDMLGYPTEDWYQPDFWATHLHPEDRSRALAKCHEFSSARENYELECRMIARDGRVVWLHNLISVTRENGSPREIRGFSIDITESKQNETALRDLTGRLINAQEEERRRVARELHDDLNQRMALLSIALGQLSKITTPSDLGRRLKSVQNQAREISADIHRLSYKLHPSKLDYLGLAPAVKSLCQEFSALGDLEVEFQQSDLPEDLPKDVTLCIFRIAQEALRNCAKHSGADAAQVTLETSDQAIRLMVSDAGCGFDLDSEAMKQGLGFTSMRERLRIVGGTMDVRSSPMCGTVIQVSVPVVQEQVTASV
jgi:PAS domain S-box-containing protein